VVVERGMPCKGEKGIVGKVKNCNNQGGFWENNIHLAIGRKRTGPNTSLRGKGDVISYLFTKPLPSKRGAKKERREKQDMGHSLDG